MENAVFAINPNKTWKHQLEDCLVSVTHTTISQKNWGICKPNCHRCGTTDMLQHALIDCPTVNRFCNQTQSYVDKLRSNNQLKTIKIKCLV